MEVLLILLCVVIHTAVIFVFGYCAGFDKGTDGVIKSTEMLNLWCEIRSLRFEAEKLRVKYAALQRKIRSMEGNTNAD